MRTRNRHHLNKRPPARRLVNGSNCISGLLRRLRTECHALDLCGGSCSAIAAAMQGNALSLGCNRAGDKRQPDFIELSARPHHRNVYNCASLFKGFDVAYLGNAHHLCRGASTDFRLAERDFQQLHHLIVASSSGATVKIFQHSGTVQPMHTGSCGSAPYLCSQNFPGKA